MVVPLLVCHPTTAQQRTFASLRFHPVGLQLDAVAAVTLEPGSHFMLTFMLLFVGTPQIADGVQLATHYQPNTRKHTGTINV